MIAEALMEKRASLENPNTPLGAGTILDVFGGGSRANSGVRVTQQTALNYGPVYACINVIAGTVGKMPIKLYRRRTDGGKDEARDHPLWEILHLRPNGEMSAVAWKEAIQGHVLTRGNGWSYIETDGTGRVTALLPMNPDVVRLDRTKAGKPFWVVDRNPAPRRIPFERLLNISGVGSDGILGWSVISHASEAIGLGLASEEYSARFFGHGSRPAGFLSHPASLSKEAAARLREQWQGVNAGLENQWKVAVLQEGITWQQMGLTAQDSELLGQKVYQVQEIARWFNVPPHKIGYLENSSFNNIEEENLSFLEDTIDPWLVRWEEALTIQLLTESERRSGLFVEFVRNATLRASTEKRAQYFRERFQTGSITPNEIRALENENPIDGGDTAYVRLDMIPMNQAGQITLDERQDLLLAHHGETRQVSREPAREERAATQRIRLRKQFYPLVESAAKRLVRGEIRDVRRTIEKLDRAAFLDWLEDYYFDEFPEFARSGDMRAALATLAAATADVAAREIGRDEPTVDPDVFADAYIETFIARHGASSRRQLSKLVREAGDDFRAAVELRALEWDEGRADSESRYIRVARRETVQMASGIAAAVWFGAGVLTLRWRAVGDTCPYCTALDGRTVGRADNFINAGEAFQPEGADRPLSPSNSIGHPPAHAGCDCTITPG